MSTKPTQTNTKDLTAVGGLMALISAHEHTLQSLRRNGARIIKWTILLGPRTFWRTK
jgi:hypothetical protein